MTIAAADDEWKLSPDAYNEAIKSLEAEGMDTGRQVFKSASTENSEKTEEEYLELLQKTIVLNHKQRLPDAKTFIKKYMMDERKDFIEAFIDNSMKTFFQFTATDRQNVKSFYKTEKKEHDTRKQKQSINIQNGGMMPMLDLETVTGRGEAYRVLTDDFLKSYVPVITFADNEDLLIYNGGIYSNMEGSAKLKIDNYITEELAFKKYSACISPNHTESVIKKIKLRAATPP